MQTQSIGGSFYFLSFNDDFSRKIWIYFRKNKSNTIFRFKEFNIEAEKKLKICKNAQVIWRRRI